MGATPRLNRAVAGQKPGNADKPGPTPADKAKVDKNLTPIMAGIVSVIEGPWAVRAATPCGHGLAHSSRNPFALQGQVRAPHPTVRKMPPLTTENSDKDMRPDSPSKAPSEFSGDGDEGDYIENDSVRVRRRAAASATTTLSNITAAS